MRRPDQKFHRHPAFAMPYGQFLQQMRGVDEMMIAMRDKLYSDAERNGQTVTYIAPDTYIIEDKK